MPTLSLIESTSAPVKVLPSGIIAVRAIDFIGAARSGLSVISDGSSHVGQAILETQKVATVLTVGGIEDLNTMFDSAADTIAIPWDSIPNESRLYSIYVRYKATGGFSATRKYKQGILSAEYGSSIGAIVKDSATRQLNGNWSTVVQSDLPYWTLFSCGLDGSVSTAGETCRIRAFTTTDNDCEFLIDQVFFVPRANFFGPAEIETLVAGEAFFNNGSDDAPPEDDDLWAGGVFSLDYNADEWMPITSGLQGMSDFQQKSDYSSSEDTEHGIGNYHWDDLSYLVIVGVGSIWIPDQIESINDDFARTTINCWGNWNNWNWWGTSGTFSGSQVISVTAGVARMGFDTGGEPGGLMGGVQVFGENISGGSTIVSGEQVPVTNAKVPDYNTAHGVKIETDISWDTPAINSYIAMIGHIGVDYFSGLKVFKGFAIISGPSGNYGVLMQYYSNSLLAGNGLTYQFPSFSTPIPGVMELSSRIPLSGSQPLNIVLERKSQWMQVTFEGTTLTEYLAAVLSTSPPTWLTYPYTFPSGLDMLDFIDDPRVGGAAGIMQLIVGPNVASGNPAYFKNIYCHSWKMSILNYGNQPPNGFIGIEPNLGGTPATLTVPNNAVHIVSATPAEYGTSNGFFDSSVNWKIKAWTPTGYADIARMSLNYFWLRKNVGCPPSIFWFYKDGQWRQKNVDTEYTLWHVKDGIWQQDCDTLHGQLQGTWQT